MAYTVDGDLYRAEGRDLDLGRSADPIRQTRAAR